MPDPTSTAVATFAAGAVTVPVITAFGVPLGLRPDVLVAGFSGALVAITLLGIVPGTGDTWRQMVYTALRRMGVAVASSLTAGYLTPMALLVAQVPDQMLLGGAFAVGGGAQQVLTFLIQRLSGRKPEAAP